MAPGRCVDAVASLPVQALRLPQATVDALHRLGVERIGQLAALARAPMVRRFGTDAALRLDQALGHAFEPIDPLVPREIPTQRAAFAEPIGGWRTSGGIVGHLAQNLCRDLEKRGEGVRRLDLILQRVDHKSFGLRVGTARASAILSTSRGSSRSAADGRSRLRNRGRRAGGEPRRAPGASSNPLLRGACQPRT